MAEGEAGSAGEVPRAALGALFDKVASAEPESIALYFGDQSYRRGRIYAVAKAVARALDQAGVPDDAPVAWVARNDPGMVVAALGLLLSGRCISLINPHEPATKMAEKVVALNAPAVIAATRDWTSSLDQATRQTGAAGIEMDLTLEPAVRIRAGLETMGSGTYRAVDADVAVELLTSGTTGEPKRLALDAQRLLKGLSFGIRKDRQKGAQQADQQLTVKRSPSLISNPMSHVAGLFRVLLSIMELRPIVLRERFTVDGFIEDMCRYRPKAASLVPAMVAMVLEADVPRDVFSSVIVVRSGTAPLRPEMKHAFEEKYGIPILSEYGASEFFGGVTMWTLGDYEKFGPAKAGAVGRPKPDVSVRVCDPETGADLPPGATGVLVLRSPRFGSDWVTTTDLASMDEDGFMFIHGRADQAIIRGGFKVLPEVVADIFRQRDDVAEACIIGIRDERLGQVPVAVIEPASGTPAPTSNDLAAYAREHLAKYQIPVAFEIVEALPRTATMKVAIGAVKEMLRGRYAF